MDKIKIGEQDSTGMDEWWCMWFRCPKCKAGSVSGHIYSSFKFCPDCGVELKWEKEIKK